MDEMRYGMPHDARTAQAQHSRAEQARQVPMCTSACVPVSTLSIAPHKSSTELRDSVFKPHKNDFGSKYSSNRNGDKSCKF